MVKYSLRKIERMGWGEQSPFDEGLRCVDRHLLPEKIESTWEAWNEGSWYDIDTIQLQCIKCSLEDEQYCLTTEREPPSVKPKYNVGFSVEIDGYNKEDFGKIVEYDFVVAVADSLGVPGLDSAFIFIWLCNVYGLLSVSDVKVTKLTDSGSFNSNLQTVGY